MNKISRICQLPDWFNLENYQCAEDLESFEWYLQISHRILFFTLLDYRTETHRPKLPEIAEASLTRYTNLVWGKDLRETHYALPGISNEQELYEHLMHSENAVTSLTLRHFTNYHIDLKHVHKWVDETGEHWDIPPNGELNPADSPIKLAHYPHEEKEYFSTARVNMKLPDEVLIESFKTWLATTRRAENSKVRKLYRKLPFDRWARFKILPLLDLELWSKKTGSKLPDHIIAAALFPDADSGPDSIRKTIRPIAHQLIKNPTELMAIAAIDMTNRILKKKIGNLEGL